MKNKVVKIALTLVVAFSTLAFTSAIADKKEIKADKSKITWKGYKVTGSHEGTIALKSGFFNFDGDKLVGGEFEVDMTSLTSTDLSGKYQANLNGHLKSDDFFGVENFPTAKLVIKKAKANGKNSYKVTGDLTIKGKTNPIAFDLSVYGSKATASLKVDRAKYDIRYGSGSFFDNLGDKTIYDEFDLVVDLQF
ncbi:YceI family protein [Leptobacterium flavescens]|uniref:YceI family protein n=1 Tax=Leptobacterium flavescens TaxID=472055 RepID=A0A6P0UGC5_9FLAO|nr:YceI family protein [Leptobacterium flavescens]NER12331.1 YceI family protein [Leptobacterium flavescens]